MTNEPGRPRGAVQSSSADGDMVTGLSALLRETGEKLTEDYYFRFCAVFDDLGIGYFHGPVPLQVIEGLAQALADASGYRVVLQAEIVEPAEDKPNTYRSVGRREVASSDPTVFVEMVRE
jgi:hypothetical protein